MKFLCPKQRSGFFLKLLPGIEQGSLYVSKKLAATPLKLAIEMENLEIVDILIRHKADIRSPLFEEDVFVQVCPLAAATKRGNIGIMRVLLDHGQM